MSDITPFTINYGMNNGFDLLWANASLTSPSSFQAQDVYIPNFLSYNFLLFIVRNNICEEDVTSCIIATKTLSNLLENSVNEPDELSEFIEPEPTYVMYNASINLFDLVRPVSAKDTHTIHIGQCTTASLVYYYLTADGYIQLKHNESIPDDAVEVVVNTSTDSVIPLYIYGIR